MATSLQDAGLGNRKDKDEPALDNVYHTVWSIICQFCLLLSNICLNIIYILVCTFKQDIHYLILSKQRTQSISSMHINLQPWEHNTSRISLRMKP